MTGETDKDITSLSEKAPWRVGSGLDTLSARCLQIIRVDMSKVSGCTGLVCRRQLWAGVPLASHSDTDFILWMEIEFIQLMRLSRSKEDRGPGCILGR